MIFIFALVLTVVAVVGLFIGRLLPPKIQRVVIITLSLFLAIAHIYIASQQLGTTGFAGSTRSPDYFSHYMGYGFAVAGLLNVAICFKSRVVSATLLAAMIIALPVFYFATW